ncbi:hypothetical protein Leryth_017763 [Lithospermum erythrorhizon]|nr:hypothetical protein Leryth_017763 [Lithospermum erythrorhizon]
MEKSCHSSGDGDSTVTSSTSTRSRNSSTSDMYLKHINKLSHKISKSNSTQHHLTSSQSQSLNIDNNQQMAAPPPVYTINKNDFREVVQKLTGSPVSSPAREQFSSPPPPPKSKPSSSRLQKIRPPPLVQISNRPPNVLNCAPGGNNTFGAASLGLGLSCQRHPFSPLPPFPTVQASAESPVSAYMRFLHNSFCFSNVLPVPLRSNSLGSLQWNNVVPPRLNNLGNPRWNSVAPPRNNLGSPRWNNAGPPKNNLDSSRWNNAVPLRSNLDSPRWTNVVPPRNNLDPLNNVVPPQWNKEGPPEAQMPPPPSPPPHQQQNIPPPQAFPLSPLPFGCLLPSPGMFSPSSLFSPTGQLGFPQLPLSPTLRVPSPRWVGR